jgi:hypothetical protein
MLTQTDDFMFPIEEDLKRKIYELIGSRLCKHGDSFDKGSAFFTKASQFLDDLEGKYFTTEERDWRNPKAGQLVHEPRYKEFHPVLGRKRSTH